MTEPEAGAHPDPAGRADATDADTVGHGRSWTAAPPVGGASAGTDRDPGRAARPTSGVGVPAAPIDPSEPGRPR